VASSHKVYAIEYTRRGQETLAPDGAFSTPPFGGDEQDRYLSPLAGGGIAPAFRSENVWNQALSCLLPVAFVFLAQFGDQDFFFALDAPYDQRRDKEGQAQDRAAS
jgi:hypothetical protein